MMKHTYAGAVKEEAIISYLLNELPETEREKIEDQCLADREMFEYIQAIEDNLTDDYVRGRLSIERRRSFEQIYRLIPSVREKTIFGRELNEILGELDESEVSARQPAKGFFSTLVEKWQSWAAATWSSWLIPVAAAALLILGAFSIYKIVSLSRRLERAQAELAQTPPLPPPSIFQRESDLASVVDIPIEVTGHKAPAFERGGSQQAQPRRGRVKIPAPGNIIELRFQLSEKEFNKYNNYTFRLEPIQNAAARMVTLDGLKAHQSGKDFLLSVPLRISDYPKDSITKFNVKLYGYDKNSAEKQMEDFTLEIDSRRQ